MRFIAMSFFLFFLFFATESFAKTNHMFRIIVTKTNNQDNLEWIYENLQSVGVEQYVSEENGEYVVYSQEFSSLSQAQYYLHLIQKEFPTAKILGENRESSTLAVGVLFAYSAIEEQGYSYGGEYGVILRYQPDENFFFSFDFTRETIESYTLYNGYVSVNYLLDSDFFLGLKGGYSILDVTGFSQSETTLLGGNIGYRYEINDTIDFTLEYSFLYGKHILQYSQNNQSEINNFHSLACIFTYNIY